MPRPLPMSMPWVRANSWPSRRPELKRDAEIPLAVGEDGFQFADRVRGFSPCRPSPSASPCSRTCRPPDTGAGWPGRSFCQRSTNTVGAAVRIDAQLGFELERADGAVDPTTCRLAGKFRISLVSGFGIVRAMRPQFLEDLAGLLQLFHLCRARSFRPAPVPRRSQPRRGHDASGHRRGPCAAPPPPGR